MLTADEARHLFSYDPETGKLTRAYSQRADLVGREAGSVYDHGYRVVSVGRARYVAARIIWLMQTGAWPVGEIDHINHQRDDNRWANLRDVDRLGNQHNLGGNRANTSGVPGVSWHKRSRKWFAHIRVGGKQKALGYFSNFEDAVAAREQGKKDHH